MIFSNPFFRRAMALVFMLASLGHAAEPVVAEGMGVTITTADLTADAQRIPAETRKSTLSKPENVQQMAASLYLRRVLAAQAERDGLSTDPATARALQIARDRILSDAKVARINASNRPTDKALDDYAAAAYKAEPARFQSPEQIRARHILIKADAPDARAKADKLLADLKAGADFEALAREHSADPGSAAKGGDLGFFGRARMAPAFEEAAFALTRPGELSGVVISPFGFHIIRLEERRAASLRPFAEVRDSLREEAITKQQEATRDREVKRLMDAARFDKAAVEAFAATQR